MSLTTEILAKLANDLAERPWAVYADGIGEAYFCPQDHTVFAPCTGKFDREGAIRFADQLRANVAAARTLHGIDAIPEVTPYVLCYGIVWEQR